MTGDCRSKNVIMKYFPETFKIVLEILKETRQKSDLDRRYTPQREMINSITNLDGYKMFYIDFTYS